MDSIMLVILIDYAFLCVRKDGMDFGQLSNVWIFALMELMPKIVQILVFNNVHKALLVTIFCMFVLFHVSLQEINTLIVQQIDV